MASKYWKKVSPNGGPHSTEVAYVLHIQQPWVWFSAFPRNLSLEFFISSQDLWNTHCLYVAQCWAKSLLAYQNHPVLTSGKQAMQKMSFPNVWWPFAANYKCQGATKARQRKKIPPSFILGRKIFFEWVRKFTLISLKKTFPHPLRKISPLKQ